MSETFFSLKFQDDKLLFIDQTQLPLVEEYLVTDSYESIANAIELLSVRGAPAIGIAAAYAVALAFKSKQSKDLDYFEKVFLRLKSTRPTAVNLFWALQKMKDAFSLLSSEDNIYLSLLNVAKEIHQDDILKCDNIAINGLQIFKSKCNVLTHCNTGKLATGGEGTALNVIKQGYKNNLVEIVYADETRPLLQGARLTAYELKKEDIPFKIITDSMAAFLMQQGKVDLVIVGADRIASNGDAANKIGSYGLAVLCKYHNIPFYIAAPETTIDFNCPSGTDIPIEERDKFEISRIKGLKFTKTSYPVYNPAFDVVPSNLITAIITDKGYYTYPYSFYV